MATEEGLATYGTEGVVGVETEHHERPILNSPEIQLSEYCQSELVREIPVLMTSSNHGIDLYLTAKHIIERYSNNS